MADKENLTDEQKTEIKKSGSTLLAGVVALVVSALSEIVKIIFGG